MLALRSKVASVEILEVETQVTRSRDEGAIFNIDAIQAVSKAVNLMPERPDPTRVPTRSVSSFYPAGLKIGSFVDSGCFPFTSDAYRIENGLITAGQGCAPGLCRTSRPKPS